jgi:hypothetical protein
MSPSLRTTLFSHTTRSAQALQTSPGTTHGTVPFFLVTALWAVLVGGLFVLLSLPAFCSRTRQRDFLRVARTDEDGGFLDSYCGYLRHHTAGLAIIVISLALIAAVGAGAAARALR